MRFTPFIPLPKPLSPTAYRFICTGPEPPSSAFWGPMFTEYM